MIYGIGTDICEIARIEAALARHGARFAHKVLCEEELEVWQTRSQRCAQRGLSYLATRFSAKEAVSKALGLGLRQPMSWHACAIVNAPSGAPLVRLHGALHDWCAARHLRLHISMTDEIAYAASFCVAEQHLPTGPSTPL